MVSSHASSIRSPGLDEQLEHRPVPERLAFAALHGAILGLGLELLVGFVPGGERVRADAGHGALELEHGRGHPRLLAPARLLKPKPVEVVMGQRQRARRVSGQRRAGLRRPAAQVSQEHAHIRQPRVGGHAQLIVGPALRGAALLDRHRHERPRVRGQKLATAAKLGVALGDKPPEARQVGGLVAQARVGV